MSGISVSGVVQSELPNASSDFLVFLNNVFKGGVDDAAVKIIKDSPNINWQAVFNTGGNLSKLADNLNTVGLSVYSSNDGKLYMTTNDHAEGKLVQKFNGNTANYAGSYFFSHDQFAKAGLKVEQSAVRFYEMFKGLSTRAWEETSKIGQAKWTEIFNNSKTDGKLDKNKLLAEIEKIGLTVLKSNDATYLVATEDITLGSQSINNLSYQGKSLITKKPVVDQIDVQPTIQVNVATTDPIPQKPTLWAKEDALVDSFNGDKARLKELLVGIRTGKYRVISYQGNIFVFSNSALLPSAIKKDDIDVIGDNSSEIGLKNYLLTKFSLTDGQVLDNNTYLARLSSFSSESANQTVNDKKLLWLINSIVGNVNSDLARTVESILTGGIAVEKVGGKWTKYSLNFLEGISGAQKFTRGANPQPLGQSEKNAIIKIAKFALQTNGINASSLSFDQAIGILAGSDNKIAGKAYEGMQSDVLSSGMIYDIFSNAEVKDDVISLSNTPLKTVMETLPQLSNSPLLEGINSDELNKELMTFIINGNNLSIDQLKSNENINKLLLNFFNNNGIEISDDYQGKEELMMYLLSTDGESLSVADFNRFCSVFAEKLNKPTSDDSEFSTIKNNVNQIAAFVFEDDAQALKAEYGFLSIMLGLKSYDKQNASYFNKSVDPALRIFSEIYWMEQDAGAQLADVQLDLVAGTRREYAYTDLPSLLDKIDDVVSKQEVDSLKYIGIGENRLALFKLNQSQQSEFNLTQDQVVEYLEKKYGVNVEVLKGAKSDNLQIRYKDNPGYYSEDCFPNGVNSDLVIKLASKISNSSFISSTNMLDLVKSGYTEGLEELSSLYTKFTSNPSSLTSQEKSQLVFATTQDATFVGKKFKLIDNGLDQNDQNAVLNILNEYFSDQSISFVTNEAGSGGEFKGLKGSYSSEQLNAAQNSVIRFSRLFATGVEQAGSFNMVLEGNEKVDMLVGQKALKCMFLALNTYMYSNDINTQQRAVKDNSILDNNEVSSIYNRIVSDRIDSEYLNKMMDLTSNDAIKNILSQYIKEDISISFSDLGRASCKGKSGDISLDGLRKAVLLLFQQVKETNRAALDYGDYNLAYFYETIGGNPVFEKEEIKLDGVDLLDKLQSSSLNLDAYHVEIEKTCGAWISDWGMDSSKVTLSQICEGVKKELGDKLSEFNPLQITPGDGPYTTALKMIIRSVVTSDKFKTQYEETGRANVIKYALSLNTPLSKNDLIGADGEGGLLKKISDWADEGKGDTRWQYLYTIMAQEDIGFLQQLGNDFSLKSITNPGDDPVAQRVASIINAMSMIVEKANIEKTIQNTRFDINNTLDAIADLNTLVKENVSSANLKTRFEELRKETIQAIELSSTTLKDSYNGDELFNISSGSQSGGEYDYEWYQNLGQLAWTGQNISADGYGNNLKEASKVIYHPWVSFVTGLGEAGSMAVKWGKDRMIDLVTPENRSISEINAAELFSGMDLSEMMDNLKEVGLEGIYRTLIKSKLDKVQSGESSWFEFGSEVWGYLVMMGMFAKVAQWTGAKIVTHNGLEMAWNGTKFVTRQLTDADMQKPGFGKGYIFLPSGEMMTSDRSAFWGKAKAELKKMQLQYGERILLSSNPDLIKMRDISPKQYNKMCLEAGKEALGITAYKQKVTNTLGIGGTEWDPEKIFDNMNTLQANTEETARLMDMIKADPELMKNPEFIGKMKLGQKIKFNIARGLYSIKNSGAFDGITNGWKMLTLGTTEADVLTQRAPEKKGFVSKMLEKGRQSDNIHVRTFANIGTAGQTAFNIIKYPFFTDLVFKAHKTTTGKLTGAQINSKDIASSYNVGRSGRAVVSLGDNSSQIAGPSLWVLKRPGANQQPQAYNEIKIGDKSFYVSQDGTDVLTDKSKLINTYEARSTLVTAALEEMAKTSGSGITKENGQFYIEHDGRKHVISRLSFNDASETPMNMVRFGKANHVAEVELVMGRMQGDDVSVLKETILKSIIENVSNKDFISSILADKSGKTSPTDGTGNNIRIADDLFKGDVGDQEILHDQMGRHTTDAYGERIYTENELAIKRLTEMGKADIVDGKLYITANTEDLVKAGIISLSDDQVKKSGTVVIEVTPDEKGNVGNISVRSGSDFAVFSTLEENTFISERSLKDGLRRILDKSQILQLTTNNDGNVQHLTDQATFEDQVKSVNAMLAKLNDANFNEIKDFSSDIFVKETKFINMSQTEMRTHHEDLGKQLSSLYEQLKTAEPGKKADIQSQIYDLQKESLALVRESIRRSAGGQEGIDNLFTGSAKSRMQRGITVNGATYDYESAIKELKSDNPKITIQDIGDELVKLGVDPKKIYNGVRMFKEQIWASSAILKGMLPELPCGSGKTIVGGASAYALSLFGKGVHLSSVTSDLSLKDAKEINGYLYYVTGDDKYVGCLCTEEIQKMSRGSQEWREARKLMYQSAITYGTMNDFVFDYMGDRNSSDPLQRSELAIHIADEVDYSLIVDLNPRILSGGKSSETLNFSRDVYLGAFKLMMRLGEDFAEKTSGESVKVKMSSADVLDAIKGLNLSSEEKAFVQQMLKDHPDQAIRQLENCSIAKHYYSTVGDKWDFAVNTETNKMEVQIINKSAGEFSQGSKWQSGLQQAVEALAILGVQDKTIQIDENKINQVRNMEFSAESEVNARIKTAQYAKLHTYLFTGMTGTAANKARELTDIVKGVVVFSDPVPPRIQVTDNGIYMNRQGMEDDLVKQVMNNRGSRRNSPVLIAENDTDNIHRMAKRFFIEEYIRLGGEISKENQEELLKNTTQRFEDFRQIDTFDKSISDQIRVNIVDYKTSSEDAENIRKIAGQYNSITLFTNRGGRGTDWLLPEAKAQNKLFSLLYGRKKTTFEDFSKISQNIKSDLDVDIKVSEGVLKVIQSADFENVFKDMATIDDQIKALVNGKFSSSIDQSVRDQVISILTRKAKGFADNADLRKDQIGTDISDLEADIEETKASRDIVDEIERDIRSSVSDPNSKDDITGILRARIDGQDPSIEYTKVRMEAVLAIKGGSIEDPETGIKVTTVDQLIDLRKNQPDVFDRITVITDADLTLENLKKAERALKKIDINKVFSDLGDDSKKALDNARDYLVEAIRSKDASIIMAATNEAMNGYKLYTMDMSSLGRDAVTQLERRVGRSGAKAEIHKMLSLDSEVLNKLGKAEGIDDPDYKAGVIIREILTKYYQAQGKDVPVRLDPDSFEYKLALQHLERLVIVGENNASNQRSSSAYLDTMIVDLLKWKNNVDGFGAEFNIIYENRIKDATDDKSRFDINAEKVPAELQQKFNTILKDFHQNNIDKMLDLRSGMTEADVNKAISGIARYYSVDFQLISKALKDAGFTVDESKIYTSKELSDLKARVMDSVLNTLSKNANVILSVDPDITLGKLKAITDKLSSGNEILRFTTYINERIDDLNRNYDASEAGTRTSELINREYAELLRVIQVKVASVVPQDEVKTIENASRSLFNSIDVNGKSLRGVYISYDENGQKVICLEALRFNDPDQVKLIFNELSSNEEVKQFLQDNEIDINKVKFSVVSNAQVSIGFNDVEAYKNLAPQIQEVFAKYPGDVLAYISSYDPKAIEGSEGVSRTAGGYKVTIDGKSFHVPEEDFNLFTKSTESINEIVKRVCDANGLDASNQMHKYAVFQLLSQGSAGDKAVSVSDVDTPPQIMSDYVSHINDVKLKGIDQDVYIPKKAFDLLTQVIQARKAGVSYGQIDLRQVWRELEDMGYDKTQRVKLYDQVKAHLAHMESINAENLLIDKVTGSRFESLYDGKAHDVINAQRVMFADDIPARRPGVDGNRASIEEASSKLRADIEILKTRVATITDEKLAKEVNAKIVELETNLSTLNTRLADPDADVSKLISTINDTRSKLAISLVEHDENLVQSKCITDSNALKIANQIEDEKAKLITAEGADKAKIQQRIVELNEQLRATPGFTDAIEAHNNKLSFINNQYSQMMSEEIARLRNAGEPISENTLRDIDSKCFAAATGTMSMLAYYQSQGFNGNGQDKMIGGAVSTARGFFLGGLSYLLIHSHELSKEEYSVGDLMSGALAEGSNWAGFQAQMYALQCLGMTGVNISTIEDMGFLRKTTASVKNRFSGPMAAVFSLDMMKQMRQLKADGHGGQIPIAMTQTLGNMAVFAIAEELTENSVELIASKLNQRAMRAAQATGARAAGAGSSKIAKVLHAVNNTGIIGEVASYLAMQLFMNELMNNNPGLMRLGESLDLTYKTNDAYKVMMNSTTYLDAVMWTDFVNRSLTKALTSQALSASPSALKAVKLLKWGKGTPALLVVSAGLSLQGNWNNISSDNSALQAQGWRDFGLDMGGVAVGFGAYAVAAGILGGGLAIGGSTICTGIGAPVGVVIIGGTLIAAGAVALYELGRDKLVNDAKDKHEAINEAFSEVMNFDITVKEHLEDSRFEMYNPEPLLMLLHEQFTFDNVLSLQKYPSLSKYIGDKYGNPSKVTVREVLSSLNIKGIDIERIDMLTLDMFLSIMDTAARSKYEGTDEVYVKVETAGDLSFGVSGLNATVSISAGLIKKTTTVTLAGVGIGNNTNFDMVGGEYKDKTKVGHSDLKEILFDAEHKKPRTIFFQLMSAAADMKNTQGKSVLESLRDVYAAQKDNSKKKKLDKLLTMFQNREALDIEAYIDVLWGQDGENDEYTEIIMDLLNTTTALGGGKLNDGKVDLSRINKMVKLYAMSEITEGNYSLDMAIERDQIISDTNQQLGTFLDSFNTDVIVNDVNGLHGENKENIENQLAVYVFSSISQGQYPVDSKLILDLASKDLGITLTSEQQQKLQSNIELFSNKVVSSFDYVNSFKCLNGLSKLDDQNKKLIAHAIINRIVSSHSFANPIQMFHGLSQLFNAYPELKPYAMDSIVFQAMLPRLKPAFPSNEVSYAFITYCINNNCTPEQMGLLIENGLHWETTAEFDNFVRASINPGFKGTQSVTAHLKRLSVGGNNNALVELLTDEVARDNGLVTLDDIKEGKAYMDFSVKEETGYTQNSIRANRRIRFDLISRLSEKGFIDIMSLIAQNKGNERHMDMLFAIYNNDYETFCMLEEELIKNSGFHKFLDKQVLLIQNATIQYEQGTNVLNEQSLLTEESFILPSPSNRAVVVSRDELKIRYLIDKNLIELPSINVKNVSQYMANDIWDNYEDYFEGTGKYQDVFNLFFANKNINIVKAALVDLDTRTDLEIFIEKNSQYFSASIITAALSTKQAIVDILNDFSVYKDDYLKWAQDKKIVVIPDQVTDISNYWTQDRYNQVVAYKTAENYIESNSADDLLQQVINNKGNRYNQKKLVSLAIHKLGEKGDGKSINQSLLFKAYDSLGDIDRRTMFPYIVSLGMYMNDSNKEKVINTIHDDTFGDAWFDMKESWSEHYIKSIAALVISVDDIYMQEKWMDKIGEELTDSPALSTIWTNAFAREEKSAEYMFKKDPISAEKNTWNVMVAQADKCKSVSAFIVNDKYEGKDRASVYSYVLFQEFKRLGYLSAYKKDLLIGKDVNVDGIIDALEGQSFEEFKDLFDSSWYEFFDYNDKEYNNFFVKAAEILIGKYKRDFNMPNATLSDVIKDITIRHQADNFIEKNQRVINAMESGQLKIWNDTEKKEYHKYFEVMLNALGYQGANGTELYGNKLTNNAVWKFQQAHSELGEDGKLGYTTIKKLIEEYEVHRETEITGLRTKEIDMLTTNVKDYLVKLDQILFKEVDDLKETTAADSMNLLNHLLAQAKKNGVLNQVAPKIWGKLKQRIYGKTFHDNKRIEKKVLLETIGMLPDLYPHLDNYGKEELTAIMLSVIGGADGFDAFMKNSAAYAQHLAENYHPLICFLADGNVDRPAERHNDLDVRLAHLKAIESLLDNTDFKKSLFKQDALLEEMNKWRNDDESDPAEKKIIKHIITDCGIQNAVVKTGIGDLIVYFGKGSSHNNINRNRAWYDFATENSNLHITRGELSSAMRSSSLSKEGQFVAEMLLKGDNYNRLRVIQSEGYHNDDYISMRDLYALRRGTGYNREYISNLIRKLENGFEKYY